MAADDQAVAAVAEPDQQQAEEQRACQVEAVVPFGVEHLGEAGLPFGVRECGQVDLVQWDLGVGHDELHRLAQAVAGEPGAQAGVAVEQEAHRRAEPVGVERGGEVEVLVHGVDVERAVVVRGVEEEPFLEGGERPDVGDLALLPYVGQLFRGEREGVCRRGRARESRGDCRQGGGGAVFEDVPGAEVQACPAGPAGDPDGADAVAAEQEEVVVGPNLWSLEHGGEDAGQQVFPGVGGLAVSRLYAARGRQRVPVQLSARAEREVRQEHVRVGHHRGWQHDLKRFAHVALGRGVTHGDEVGGERGAVHGHRGAGDARQAGQGGFDLAQFDAVTAEFDLPVGTAEILDDAVLAAADQVAGAVHPGAGRAVGVGDEPFGGQPRPLVVPPG